MIVSAGALPDGPSPKSWLEAVSTDVCCKNSHDLVVCSSYIGSANTETTPGFLLMARASSFDSLAAKPENACSYLRTIVFSARCPLQGKKNNCK